MEDLSLASLFDGFSHHNNGFKLFRYFTACFGVLPSSIRIVLPVEGSKEAIDSILKHMGLERFSFMPVFKNWHTDDSKDAKMSDDYAYEYVFKSEIWANAYPFSFAIPIDADPFSIQPG